MKFYEKTNLDFILMQEIVVDLDLFLGKIAPYDKFVLASQVGHFRTWRTKKKCER